MARRPGQRPPRLPKLPRPPPRPPPPYELYAVVSHTGSLGGGHYVAHVRCGSDWFAVDDGAVLPSDEAAARRAQPYLLFYRRPVAPREGGDGAAIKQEAAEVEMEEAAAAAAAVGAAAVGAAVEAAA